MAVLNLKPENQPYRGGCASARGRAGNPLPAAGRGTSSKRESPDGARPPSLWATARLAGATRPTGEP